jgi:hypothetical protein
VAELYSHFARVAFAIVINGYFGLLGVETEWLFWILSIITIVLTVRYWHKFHTHNFRNVFTRFTLLILSNVLVVASVGISINRAGTFYAGWSDLFGFQSNLKQIAIAPENLALLTKKDLQTAKKTKAGSLIFKKVITGQDSGISARVIVVMTPKVVNAIKHSKNFSLGSDYQVVELFPGYPGVPETWIGALKGLDAMETMEKENKIPPTIAIIPAINVVPGLDTECLNIPGTSDVETWLTSDMKTFAQRFIGVDDRKWSAFGYSTGGWCSAEVGIRHQDQYGSIVSLAGYFAPAFSAGVTSSERAVLKNEYDLVATLHAQPNTLQMMAIYSRQNDFETKSLFNFKNKVSDVLALKTVEIPEGGHNIKTWQPYVYTGFEWLASLGQLTH